MGCGSPLRFNTQAWVAAQGGKSKSAVFGGGEQKEYVGPELCGSVVLQTLSAASL